jgi:hypothetical protein
MPERPIIPDRAEFVDALRLLRQGHVLVKTGVVCNRCILDGQIVYHSYATLLDYGLIGEFDNPQGFANARYYRITPAGRAFAERAVDAWQRTPVLQRMAVRLTG